MSGYNPLDVDQLLEILGNETRRRILQLLADEPRYFNQLTRELSISQQAVLKHLELLEQSGLISSFRAKSSLAAPDRKYYHLNRSLYLSVSIAGDTVGIYMKDIGLGGEVDTGFGDLEELEETVGDLKDDKSIGRLLASSRDMLRKIDERIEELERHKISLLKLRQAVLNRAHKAIRARFEEDLERRILYSTLALDVPFGIESLSERLGVREKEVARALEALGRRLDLLFG